MQFRNFAENLLGSKVKIKLLGHLVSEGAITSEREIARLIGLSPGAVNRALKEFHDLNLITPMKVGNITTWRLNESSYAYEYLENFFSKLKSRETPLSDLVETVKILSRHSEIKKAILFGSVAEGRELPESDIDLFILVESEKNMKNIYKGLNDLNILETSCLIKYGNKLNLHIFTSDNMKNPKNKKILENVMKGIRVIER